MNKNIVLIFLKIFYKIYSGIIPDFFSNNLMEIITRIDPVFLEGNFWTCDGFIGCVNLIEIKMGPDQDPEVWSIFWIHRVLSLGPEHNLTEIRCLQRSELHVWSAVVLSNKKVASELHSPDATQKMHMKNIRINQPFQKSSQ